MNYQKNKKFFLKKTMGSLKSLILISNSKTRKRPKLRKLLNNTRRRRRFNSHKRIRHFMYQPE